MRADRIGGGLHGVAEPGKLSVAGWGILCRARNAVPHYVEPIEGTRFAPDSLVALCVEAGAEALLLDRPAIPGEFFDLRSRLAGELLHALSKYRLRLAAVIDDPTAHSQTFQDFVRESNAGRQFRFFSTRSDAILWLESIEGS